MNSPTTHLDSSGLFLDDFFRKWSEWFDGGPCTCTYFCSRMLTGYPLHICALQIDNCDGTCGKVVIFDGAAQGDRFRILRKIITDCYSQVIYDGNPNMEPRDPGWV